MITAWSNSRSLRNRAAFFSSTSIARTRSVSSVTMNICMSLSGTCALYAVTYRVSMPFRAMGIFSQRIRFGSPLSRSASILRRILCRNPGSSKTASKKTSVPKSASLVVPKYFAKLSFMYSKRRGRLPELTAIPIGRLSMIS